MSLSFQGDLGAIEAVGFETHGVFADQAVGVVRFKDIPSLDAHPDVLWLAAGRAPERDLDTAARDIRARASAPISGPSVDGVWHADVASGALTKIPQATGRGVIVAIMDTGIDHTHPMFISQRSPTVKTRILRIWDQGLIPSSVSDCPPQRLLASADTYGVEYDSGEIEADLNGGAPIAHRDCDGHGTHVAGIAAGGTLFGPFGDASRVGVAPEADIIAVKFLDNPKIHYRLASNAVGAEVGEMMTFRDGVLYCLRTARELDNRPVVINMSFGDPAEPGDGLDEGARFVDALLDPSRPTGESSFPRRAVVVKAAGNRGVVSQLTGRIEVPASGEITAPFKLVDQRDGAETDRRNCQQVRYTPHIGAHFWYRRPAAPSDVQFAVRLPFGPAPFRGNVKAGGKLELAFNPIVGPPRDDVWVALAGDIDRITIDHKDMPPVPHPAGGTVQRQYALVAVGPKTAGGTLSYHEGVYEVRIKAPPGTIIFVASEIRSWNATKAVFRLDDKMRDGLTPRHPNIVEAGESTSVDSLGQHVLTVASYGETAPDAFTPAHAIAETSSRGPLRDFSDPPRPPFCPKPDIAAPGVQISSAQSRHVEGLLHWPPWWYLGVRFHEESGTSMATPMVAGTVALMLEKNPGLNVTDVRAALSATTRAAVSPAAPPASTNAYGVGMLDTRTSHINTP